MSKEIRKTNWEKEYISKGIPSSFKNEPSGTLLWFLTNINYITNISTHPAALDVGCGKGRNSIYLATQNYDVTAFDLSSIAIEKAKNDSSILNLEDKLNFYIHDLNNGLPGSDHFYDIIIDIFVYKHQVDLHLRNQHRKNLFNKLKKDGLLLLSLADKNDGYYSKCPRIPNNNNGILTIVDMEVGIESILFDLYELNEEMSDLFNLEMAWIKSKSGIMHSQYYERKTIATIWSPKI